MDEREFLAEARKVNIATEETTRFTKGVHSERFIAPDLRQVETPRGLLDNTAELLRVRELYSEHGQRQPEPDL